MRQWSRALLLVALVIFLVGSVAAILYQDPGDGDGGGGGCVPDCAGKVCGDDGCLGLCGTCAPGFSCDVSGQCVCVADCTGKSCGDDGCGGLCGTCAPDESCDASGQCACVADCTGKACGDDGCGGSCGTCTIGKSCDASGACVLDINVGGTGAGACISNCTGKECGDDGCGGSCGTCLSGTCTARGTCDTGPQQQGPSDADGDGVADADDACPSVAGTYCHGCPQPGCGACEQAVCPASGAPSCESEPASTTCGSLDCSSRSTACVLYGIYTEYCDGLGACDSLTCGAVTPTYPGATASCTTLQSQAGHCDGAGTCVADGCTDSRTNATVCSDSGRACGTAMDTCSVARACSACASGFSCDALGQCVSSCTDACASGDVGCSVNAPWTCGEAGDGDACLEKIVHAGCGDAKVCVSGLCASVAVSATPQSATLTAGEILRLSFAFVPDAGLTLVNKGWPSGASTSGRNLTWVTTPADVGSHTVHVTAESVTAGGAVGAADVQVTVRCNPADASTGACCDAVGGQYRGEGASCAFNSTETGSCTVAHQCARVCTPGAARQCDGNVVRSYDSCGQAGAAITDCASLNKSCSETGGAHCEEQQQNATCGEPYAYDCLGQQGRRTDSCGQPSVLVTCDASQRCNASVSGVACAQKGACEDAPGTLSCGTRCVDPLTSHGDCSGCGRGCGQDEQCVAGACQLIPGCNVVCSSNGQCGPGEVCVNPGDCALSQCQAQNLLEQDPQAAAGLSQALTQSGLVRVEMNITGSVIRYTVTNMGAAPIANVTITSTIGKVVARSASSLRVSGVEYSVLQADPVLRFAIPRLETVKRFSVSADHTLDASYVNMIANEIAYGAAADALANWNATKDALTIGVGSAFDGNSTTFRITLNPSRSLSGVSVPLEIPKCLAARVADLQLSGNYHVVQDDPLIVWQFDELSAPADITFSVPKDVSEDCKAQLRALAYSQRVGQPLNPWFGLALIPLLGATLVFFQRFGKPSGRLSKGEFLRLAQEQGMGENEALSQWAEYKTQR